MDTFKCKICLKTQPLGDSVSIQSKMCVDCFTSINIHKRVSDKIAFYKKTLSEQNELTPIKIRKIRNIEKFNEILSFSRCDILVIESGGIESYVEELKENPEIYALRYWKKKYIVRKYDIKDFDLEKMVKTFATYKDRIIGANRNIVKFSRFINIIAKESQFRVLKDMMRTSIYKFIDDENPNIYLELKKFIMNGVAYTWEPGLMPKVSIFLHDNYEHIFSTLLTQILPFDKERITFDFPSVNSRTDFGLKMFYRYNHVELNVINKAIEKYCDPAKKMNKKKVTKFLFINSIKTISKILSATYTLYYRKLKINSGVKTAFNIEGSSQTTTKRYNEVTYRISMREN